MNTLQLTPQEAAFLQTMNRMKKLPVMRLYPNLSPPEVHLLACVQEREDGITVSKLTRLLDMPMPAVSRLMRGMEERGLIERSILPKDRRSILVRITAQGRTHLDQFQAAFHNFFEEVLSSTDPEEFGQTLRQWNRLLDLMETLMLERSDRHTSNSRADLLPSLAETGNTGKDCAITPEVI